MTSPTTATTAVTLDSANQRLSEVFAPWISDLKLQIDQLDSEGLIMRLPYSDDLCRSGNIICGQALMSLIDTCGLERYSNVATVGQNTSFLRPARHSDVLAHGKVIKAGRSLVFGEVTLITEADGKTVCTGTSTYAVIPD
jgi:uncharacterized protein (TIGR00369 family)